MSRGNELSDELLKSSNEINWFQAIIGRNLE